MLDYLVPSRTRRRLLEVLWRDGEQGTVSELARTAEVSFAAAHAELRAMARAGLARRQRSRYCADHGHPDAKLVRELVSRRARRARPRSDDQLVVSWLKALGAPLTGPAASSPPTVEQAIAQGLWLAHRDAAVARVLPLCIWRSRRELSFERLRAEARRLDEHQTLGFYLELTGELGGDRTLLDEAARLRDRRYRRQRDFFVGGGSAMAARLAELNTPPVARRWNFRINMGRDSFEALFDKHEGGGAAL